MKLLDVPAFENISSAISGYHGNLRLDCKLESYSCKMAGEDKKLFKQISNEGQPDDLELLASPSSLSASAGEGSLVHTASRKTLYYLKATLNASFAPDYDFSNAKSDEFCREPSYDWVTKNISSNLLPALGDQFHTLAPQLWASLQDEIDPLDCEIYSYNPDSQGDPFSEDGSLWSVNYFFYNKKKKRVAFFVCRATSYSAPMDDEEMDMDDDLMFQGPYDDSGMAM